MSKELILVSYKDDFHLDRHKRLWIVNNKSYDSSKYRLLLSETPVVEPETPRLPDNNGLPSELKSLTTCDLLKKKLIRYFNGLDKLKGLTGDDKLLKVRSQIRSKKIIKKYLGILRADANFNIERLESAISLNYLGKYASCKRVVVL